MGIVRTGIATLAALSGCTMTATAGLSIAQAADGSPRTGTGLGYQETVSYITDKILQAGIPGGTRHGKHDSTYLTDDIKYSVTVNACESMTVIYKEGLHVDDPSDTPSHQDSLTTVSMTVPFRLVAMIRFADTGASEPEIFSTHTMTENPNNGATFADGFPTGAWNMKLFGLGAGGGEVSDGWHDVVYVVLKDGVVEQSTGTEISPTVTHIKPDVPVAIAPFFIIGTGETSTHVANAIRHLVDLCINHPEQAPKEPF
jgi:hypothetical protein